MSKIISITMAAIIMLTANTTASITYAATPQSVTVSVKTKPSSHKNKKKKKHKHMMPKGNMGKWFKSKKALKKYVKKVMRYWAELEEEGIITREEYYEKCPSGYEAWCCSCGKWTGNFKYD